MNSHALEVLNQGQVDIAFQILLKCQEVYKRNMYRFDISLAILTMNHLACCYKHIGHPKISRRILDEATQLLFKRNIVTYRAMTYLNKCAVLSILGNHEKALENARIAAEYFENEILEMDTTETEDEFEFRTEFIEKVKLLTICYYNMSVEAECIKNMQQCIKAIKQALKLYYFFLEDDSSMKQLYSKLIAHDRKIHDDTRETRTYAKAPRRTAEVENSDSELVADLIENAPRVDTKRKFIVDGKIKRRAARNMVNH